MHSRSMSRHNICTVRKVDDIDKPKKAEQLDIRYTEQASNLNESGFEFLG